MRTPSVLPRPLRRPRAAGAGRGDRGGPARPAHRGVPGQRPLRDAPPQGEENRLERRARATGRDDPPLRRFRFTVAHEIGHWVCPCLSGRAPKLEPSYCRAVYLTDAADRTLEREANVFAAEHLMPEAAARAAWDELGEVEACAARFGVSPTAMQWRRYGFGFVEERPPV